MEDTKVIGVVTFANGENLEIATSGTLKEFVDSLTEDHEKEKYVPFKITSTDNRTFKLCVTSAGNINRKLKKFSFDADDYKEMELERTLEEKGEKKKEGANIPPAHAPGGRCHGWISFE